MSSDPPSDAPSPGRSPPISATEDDAKAEAAFARLVSARGRALVDALDAHLPGAREHADGTASYAFAGAASLGLGRNHCELVREVARLHDIGKVYVPAELLARPPAELDPAGAELVRSHFESASKLARGAGLPETVCRWLLCVRERFDGKGPEGLAGERIPIESRVIRVACAYDVLTSDPAFGESLAERQRVARAALRGTAGAELDPHVVDALAQVLDAASG